MTWLLLGIITGISGLTLFSYSDKATAKKADSWYDPHKAEGPFIEEQKDADGE